MDARCCIPPESSRGYFLSNPTSPTCSSKLWINSASGFFRLISKGSRMLPIRSRQGRRFASWKIMAISGCGSTTLSLPSRTSPALRS